MHDSFHDTDKAKGPCKLVGPIREYQNEDHVSYFEVIFFNVVFNKKNSLFTILNIYFK